MSRAGRFQDRLDNLSNVFPEENENADQRPEVNVHVKREVADILDFEKFLKNYEMSGTADRKKFRKSLDDSQNRRVKNRQM